jgi:3-(3-hydroxy-phenyl)propionate hydroxylase
VPRGRAADPARARKTDIDVIVVGFGPVGAALAGLLGKRGIDVLVLERDYDVFALPRAAHVDHTGLRTWQELGLLDQILPAMQANVGLDFLTAGGHLLARIPSDQPSASGLPSSMYFFQPMLDSLVRGAVSTLPTVQVRLGCEVTDVVVGADSVLVTAIDRGSGGNMEVSARWLVGCDGAASRIRETLGMGLEDLGFEEPWLVVDLLSGLPESGSDRAVCLCDPRRPMYSIPMPLGRHRFEFRLMERDDLSAVLEPERIEALVDPQWANRAYEIERAAIYTFHGLVADKWREQRVFLAGDAAHQMPPFLGQGMCSGLRDATNLAWKLDLVLRGRARDDLLDTYQEERRAHVRAVVEAAVAIGRIICTVDPDAAAERDRRMLADTRPPTQRIAFALPALRPGPLIKEGGGDLFVQPTGDGVRLDDLIGPRFAVLARRAESLANGAAGRWRDRAGAFVASVDDLPRSQQRTVLSWLDNHDSDIVVVRPDRYVLWSGHDLEPVTAELGATLTGVLAPGPSVSAAPPPAD